MKSEISSQVIGNIDTVSSAINSCIQVQEVRISRKVTIPHQVNFCLDANLIRQIEWIQNNEYQLVFSSSNLASLRYYVLFHLPLEQIGIDPGGSSASLFMPRSPLTFSTAYSFDNSQSAPTLFRSFIDLEGNISQQIHQDLWQDYQLLLTISQAHYWLVLEILAQLPWKSSNQQLWFILICSGIVGSIVSVMFYSFISVSLLLNLAIFLIIILVSKIVFQRIVIKHLKQILIYHLRAGWFRKNIQLRHIGLQILNFII